MNNLHKSKEDILNAIKSTAKENGGNPLKKKGSEAKVPEDV